MSKIDELKKKLEKQAEKSCALNDRIHVDCFVSGYLKGSLPREKRIAELEESNRELQKLVQQREQRGLEVQEDLLKEKGDLETRCNELFLQNNEFTEQLTKAKKIIKQLMYAARDCIAWYCLCDKAKQFLKEIENE